MKIITNKFAKTTAIILTVAFSFSIAGCNNVTSVYPESVDPEPIEGNITESDLEVAEPTKEPVVVSEDEPEEEQEDNTATKEIATDIESQLKIIADNYDLFFNTMFPEGVVYPNTNIAVTDLNHNGRLEAIVSTCQGSGAFSTTYFYEISEDYSSLDKLNINGDVEYDTAADFLVSEMYVDDDYDYTVFDCYKKDDEYYYLIKDYCSAGWSEKFIAYFSYSINGRVKRDLVGGCYVSPDSDTDTLIVHTKLTGSLNERFADKESYMTYMNEYWSEYEKQSNCAIKWVALSDDEDFLESIKKSYEAFNPECGRFDVIDYEYETFFSSWYQDYEYVVETE